MDAGEGSIINASDWTETEAFASGGSCAPRPATDRVRSLFASASSGSETLSGPSASAFLKRLGLPHPILRRLWAASKASTPSHTSSPGISLAQFDALLRLAALAQSGRDLPCADDASCIVALVARAREADLLPELDSHCSSSSIAHPWAVCIRPPPHSLRSSVQLRCLALFNRCILAAPSLPHAQFRAWNVSNAELCTAPGPKSEPSCAPCLLCGADSQLSTPTCIAPNSERDRLYLGHRDGSISVWDFHHVSKGLSKPLSIIPAHGSTVKVMAVDKNGKLWSGSHTGSVRIWSTVDGVCNKDELMPKFAVRPGNKKAHSSVTCMAYCSATDQMWTSGQTSVLAWEASSGNYLFTLYGEEPEQQGQQHGPDHEQQQPDQIESCENDNGVDGLQTASNLEPEPRRSSNSEFYGETAFAETESEDTSTVTVCEGDSAQTETGSEGRHYTNSGIAASVRRVGGRWLGNPIGKVGTLFTKTGKMLDFSRGEKDKADFGSIHVVALETSNTGFFWLATSPDCKLRLFSSKGNLLTIMEFNAVIWKLRSVTSSLLWTGHVDGTICSIYVDEHGGSTSVLTQSVWSAHLGCILDLAVDDEHVYSLGAEGGLKRWHRMTPHDPESESLRKALCARSTSFTSYRHLRCTVGTWNVGDEHPPRASLAAWLGANLTTSSIIALSLQEAESGTGSFLSGAAREQAARWRRAENVHKSDLLQWWEGAILEALDDVDEAEQWKPLAHRQLSGIITLVFARQDVLEGVGDANTSAVRLGFMGIGGNKGAIAIRLLVYGNSICFINGHFQAHQGNVNKRNADYEYAANGFSFELATPAYKGEDVPPCDISVAESDAVICAGDFNYRIDRERDEVEAMANQGDYDGMLEADQLNAEMRAGRVFHGFREPGISFAPTFKYDNNTPGLAFDSGEKRRTPAYCDRILFRGSSASRGNDTCSASNGDGVRIQPAEYTSCMEVLESDHKPVRCVFSLRLPVVDEAKRREVALEAAYGGIDESMDWS